MKTLSDIGPGQLPVSLDYRALYDAMVAATQRLSGSVWTDYNAHDPGVTLIEALCYALTDLAYRARLDTEQLLFPPGGSRDLKDTFYQPEAILPAGPVSAADYRRLLIDGVRDLRNAWMDPIENHPHGYKGLFNLRLQLTEDIERTTRREEVVREVRKLIMANRNLGEDLERIVVLEPVPLYFTADIHIDPDAFAEKVLADLLYTLGELLNPSLRLYTQDELLDQGLSTYTVFDGPHPSRGFIRPDELQPLPGGTSLSEIRDVISRAEGVQRVDHLTIWKQGRRVLDDDIFPDANTYLNIDPRMAEATGGDRQVRLLRGGLAVELAPRQTQRFLNLHAVKTRRRAHHVSHPTRAEALGRADRRTDATRPPGSLADYHSLQRTLPTAYGVGPDGPGASATLASRTKAAQLKGYLMIFEQFLADYLAQLNQLGTLWSVDESLDPEPGSTAGPTYFTQPLLDVPAGLDLWLHGSDTGAPYASRVNALTNLLTQLVADAPKDADRRARLLDHLLARFGEQLTDDLFKTGKGETEETRAARRLRIQANLLRRIPELGRRRSMGFNYTRPAWQNDNVSGVEEKVGIQLGLDDEVATGEALRYQNRNLVPSTLSQPTPPTAGPTTEADAEDRTTPPPRLRLHQALARGTNRDNYQIVKLSAKQEQYELRLSLRSTTKFEATQATPNTYETGSGNGTDGGTTEGQQLFTGSQADAKQMRERLIDQFSTISRTSEGFFLLENILLRPRANPGHALVATVASPDLPPPGTIQLRSLYYQPEGRLRSLSDSLAYTASFAANWVVADVGDAYLLVLVSDGRPELVSPPFTERRQASEAAEVLRSYYERLLNAGNAAATSNVRLEPEQLRGHTVPADFYSLRLSVVAPDWPARFQDVDFRRVFRRAVSAAAPVHLHIDYYWLRPKELARFTTDYRQWLDTKAAGDAGAAERRALRLINQLRGEETGRPPTQQAGKLSRSQLNSLLEPDNFGYAIVFKSTSLQGFALLDAADRRALASAGVNSWRALIQADASTLRERLRQLGRRVEESLLGHWQAQAKLFRSERWRDLLELQGQLLEEAGLDGPLPVDEAVRRWLDEHAAAGLNQEEE